MFSQACVILLSTVGVCLWVRGGVPLGPGVYTLLDTHTPSGRTPSWTHTPQETHTPWTHLQTQWSPSGRTHPIGMLSCLLLPTNEVCEGYVFTGVCLSMGGVHGVGGHTWRGHA